MLKKETFRYKEDVFAFLKENAIDLLRIVFIAEKINSFELLYR